MKKIIWTFLSLFVLLIGIASCSSNDNDDVAVTGLSLDQSTLTIVKGETAKLNAVISPDNATDRTVTWQSSNVAVATVDQNGNVKGIGGGQTVVTAASADGKCFASCIINVSVNVASITLLDTYVTMTKGESRALTVTIYPEDATDKKLMWSTSNPNVVTVENGTIKAANAGTAIITAATGDGKVKAVCYVSVIVPVERISLSEQQLSLVVGQKYDLSATVLPEDATSKTLKWETSNESIVTVDKGKLVAISSGTAVVKVTTEDGNHSSSCTVTVRKSQNIGYDPYGNGQQW